MELTRRKFLKSTVLGAAMVVAGPSLTKLNLGSLVTEKSDAPQAAPQWDLQVTNLAGDTVDFPFDQIMSMAVTSVGADLYCSDDFLVAGNWTGVSVGSLLQQAGLDPNVDTINLVAQDGYEVSIPLSEATDPYVIIAYQLDGSFLPEVLRLVIPGIGGAVWIKTITSITMIDSTANVSQRARTSVDLAGPASTRQWVPVQPPSCAHSR